MTTVLQTAVVTVLTLEYSPALPFELSGGRVGTEYLVNSDLMGTFLHDF
jgi:hypothetical protein